MSTIQAGRFGWDLDTTQVDQNAIDVFSLGWCWALAEAMHKATGWPIVIVGGVKISMDLAKLTDWEHALVQRPDGKVVDILGLRDAPDDLRTLEDIGWTVEQLAEVCNDADDLETPRRIAKIYADLILAGIS